MSIAEYMLPLEGETADQLAERLFREWLYARGGNHPDDVNRWLREYTTDQLVAMYQETWGQVAEDEDYVPADPLVDQDIFEVLNGGG